MPLKGHANSEVVVYPPLRRHLHPRKYKPFKNNAKSPKKSLIFLPSGTKVRRSNPQINPNRHPSFRLNHDTYYQK